MALEIRKTLCNRDCPDACSIVAHVDTDTGRITKLGGDPDHPITRGFLCWRTNHYLPVHYSPDRLTSPLYRESLDDEFSPISWDAALDLAAARLLRIREESGPAAIFHYRSGGSLGLTKHLTDYFFEKLGPVTIKRGDICSGAGDAAQHADFGHEDANDIFDLLNSKHILLWGKNVFVSSPHMVPILNDAKARGAALVLIDPVHHRTASLCERFVQPRPGGDFALAMAIARILIDGGVAHKNAHRVDNFAEFRALAETRSIDDWCHDADVLRGAADDLAARFAEGPTAVLVGWGMGRRINGAGIVRAIDALSALSGNLGVRGGGSSFYFKRRGAFDTSFVRGEEVAPRSLCEPLLGKELLAAADPPVRAVWITAGNPVVMLPESETIDRALRSREFVVVVDAFMTDTARAAHLVLPTTTLLEADDLVGSYGHHYIGSATPLVPPPINVRSDLEILQGLASRVGLDDVMAGDIRSWKRRLMRKELGEHGVTLETLEKGAVKNPLATEILFPDSRVQTATGRTNLMTSAPPDERPAREFPLWLLSLSTDRAQSSQWSEAQDGPAIVTIHPDAAPGIPDGALARLESAIGVLTVRIRHDAQQRRDVALVPKGGHYGSGRCANRLIRARTTDAGEGGALYDEGVRLVPAT